MGASLLRQDRTAEGLVLRPEGRWTVETVATLDRDVERIPAQTGTITIDLSGLEGLDTAGALLLRRAMRRCQPAGDTCRISGGTEAHLDLLSMVAANDREPSPMVSRHAVADMFERVGRATLDALAEAKIFTGFLGLVVERGLRAAMTPWRFRFTALVHQMEQAGLNALPIIGLVSFLIGVVMAYQGAVQLRLFGAEIYTVDLLAVSILRELGVLLTAIIVAGRSGSAFTAEIGAMKFREEIDAMRVLGIDPVDALVLPRMLALILTLPVVTFFANAMALTGGALLCWMTLDIAPAVFVERFSNTNPWHFYTGMIKAPVFAAVIALVGCHAGMQVTGRAESVGRMTTKSVVQSIFLVIVIDAIFSIFFNVLKI